MWCVTDLHFHSELFVDLKKTTLKLQVQRMMELILANTEILISSDGM